MMAFDEVQELNRELWQSYEPVIAPGAESPLAFIVRVRDERDATQVVARFKAQGCEIGWLKRRWWPFGHRWEIAAKTAESVTLSPAAIDQWSDALLRDLRGFDVTLHHWVPTEAGP